MLPVGEKEKFSLWEKYREDITLLLCPIRLLLTHFQMVVKGNLLSHPYSALR